MPIPILELTNGSKHFDLWDVERFIVAADGTPSPELPLDDTNVLTEQWTFHLVGADTNELAKSIQEFKRAMNQVNEFGFMSSWSMPWYIREKGDCEDNDRHALIREVSSLQFPDLRSRSQRTQAQKGFMAGVQMKLIREHPWRHLPPGQLGSADATVHGRPAIELAPSNGPAAPVLVWAANFRDDGNVTHIYHYDDSAATFSANLIAAAIGTALWPAAPAAADLHYAGSTDIAFKHVIYGIDTGAVINWNTKLQYWNGAAWTDMTLGTEYTLNRVHGGETVNDDQFFVTQDDAFFAINLFPARMAGWAKTVINAVNAYWVRVNIVAVTSTTTLPTKNADTIYSQRVNYVEVPAASIKGDTWPVACIRVWAPSGADQNPSEASISRILVGAKSDPEDGLGSLTNFEPMINCGNSDNPGAWTTTYDTDTSAVADIAYPGGSKGRTTFATDGTLRVRIKLTGAALLPDYRGEYRVFVGFKQVGGVAGDVSLSARVFNGEELESDPHTDLGLYTSLSADLGIEVADLGLIQIPRSRVYANDPIETINVAIHLLAERAGGSAAQLDWAWLYFFPVTEGSVGIDDPVTDSNRGSSAIRGGSYLELDNGCVANRTVKFQAHQTDNVTPSEEWARFDTPIEFRNIGARTRLYFLMESYTSEGWGVEPLIANLGVGAAVEVFMHYRYLFLRGQD